MKGFVFSTLILVCGFTHAQQDPLYSQYQFNQLMINPAYAGIYDRFSAGLISRYQWAGIEGAPVTNTLTVQSALKYGKIGIGGVLLNDRFGISDNYELQISGSYNVLMQDAKLAFGLQGELIRHGFNLNNLELDFLDDPEVLNVPQSFQKPNFGIGVMHLREKFFIGASVPRILNVNESDGLIKSERYRKLYYFTGGFVFSANELIKLKTVSMIRSIAGQTISFDLLVSANLDEIFRTGVSIRDFQEFGLFANMLVAKRLRLGYSFELPANSLIRGSYGTHEISVSIDFGVNGNKMERYF
ncbi:MAG: type IX secretion system membrane protein PorP/SprF [Cyclobacteriaceae bacterium]